MGRSGEIASSPDGMSWTDHPTGSDAYLQDVNFFNGTYVAVGLEDSLLTSPDLLNWTARTSGIETTDRKNFAGLEVTKHQFVLFQGLGVPSVSRDGVNWTLIEGSNVRFFATATGVDDLLGVYSLASGQVIHNPPGNDPGDWERLVLPVAANFTALASGNGIVVGVGQNGLLMSSPLESGGYDGWATGQFGATGEASVKEATADPDGDGQSNLEEYVRQTNPNVGTPSLPLEQRQTSFGPEITWRQSVAAHDVQTTVEHSHDLQEWSSEGVSLSEKDPIGDDQTFTARVTGESGTTGELYLRVRWNLVR